MATNGRLGWMSLGILCVMCSINSVIIDISPDQSSPDNITFDANGTTLGDLGDQNMTSIDNDTVDVEDFYVGMNRTMNGTDINGTLADETTTVFVRPVSAECQWFHDNPFWRLTSTTTIFRKYMCACYNLCPTDEEVAAIQEIAKNLTVYQTVFERRGDFMFYFIFVLYILVVLLGTTANIIVIIGIVGVMKDKTVVNRFVVSLAIADLFLSAFITPIKVLYHVDVMKDMKENWFCKFMLYMRQMAQAEAIVILTIIACERYYAICHPLKAKFRCSMKRANILIMCSWVVSLVLALPSVISAEYLTDRSAGAICVIHYTEALGLQLHYVYLMVVLLVIPTGIMGYTYGRICFVLWISSQKAAEMTGGNSSGKMDKDKKGTPSDVAARKRIIVTMVVLLIVFLICWAPRLVVNVVFMFDMYVDPFVKYYGDLISELLANSHSLLNPFMFIALSRPLKQALAKHCCPFLVGSKTLGTGSGVSSSASGQTMSSTANGLKSEAGHSSNHI